MTAGWIQHACTVAAYRDRYAIVGASALVPVPELAAQPRDTAQARSALVAAKRIVEEQDALATPRAGRARSQVIPNDRNRL